MKTLRLFSTILMVVTLCFGFAACDDDDDKDHLPPSTLVGTTWEGNHNEFTYKIYFGNSGNGHMTVTGKENNEVASEDDMTYVYDSTSGIVKINYLLDEFTGNVQGDKMKISRTAQDDSIELHRK
ncbi:MAG: hypothetical protein LUE93_01155 [Bacteroides sp.]|nr:hypothetical protein [Bacteroides sp.]